MSPSASASPPTPSGAGCKTGSWVRGSRLGTDRISYRVRETEIEPLIARRQVAGVAREFALRPLKLVFGPRDPRPDGR